MTNPDLPAPLVHPEANCQNLPAFMFDTEKFLASELVAVAKPEHIGSCLFLWVQAWKQVPAGSLPNDDAVLAGTAKVSLKRWAKIRDVCLRGFVLCNDGRLYNRTLCKDVNRALSKREAYQERAKSGAKARWNKDNDHASSMLEAQRMHGSSNACAMLEDAQGQGHRHIQEDSSSGSLTENRNSDPFPDDDDPIGTVAADRPVSQASTRSVGDLEVLHSKLLIYREDRTKAQQLLTLYGFEAVNAVLTSLAPIAEARPSNKRRIMVSELQAALDKRYELTIEDYQRANLPAPDEVANAR